MAIWLNLWTLTCLLKQLGFSELDPHKVKTRFRRVVTATRETARSCGCGSNFRQAGANRAGLGLSIHQGAIHQGAFFFLAKCHFGDAKDPKVSVSIHRGTKYPNANWTDPIRVASGVQLGLRRGARIWEPWQGNEGVGKPRSLGTQGWLGVKRGLSTPPDLPFLILIHREPGLRARSPKVLYKGGSNSQFSDWNYRNLWCILLEC